MKILNPGRVEQRKFVCTKCGCIFVADEDDVSDDGYVSCPQHGCGYHQKWKHHGIPYEEPTQDKKSDTEHLAELLLKTYELQWPVTTQQAAEFLIANGVTFREVQADE